MSKQSSINSNFEFIRQTLNYENTTTFNNSIANATSVNEAIFVSWFIYMWEAKSKNGEMFIIEDAFIQRTGVPRYSFRKIVKKWEGLGIIKTELKGVPMKKYYQLKKSKFIGYIHMLFDSKDTPSKSNGVCSAKHPRSYNTESITIKKRDPKESLSPGTCKNAGRQRNVIPGNGKPLLPNSNIPKKKTFSDRMSKKLYIKVKSKNQLPFNSKSRTRWTSTFSSMLKEDGRNKKRIRTVLDWYIEHYGEDFIPEARCANTFRKKFCEIEAAMKRSSVADGNGKSTRSVIVNYAEERIMD